MKIYNVYCNTVFDYKKKFGTYAIIIKEDNSIIFHECKQCSISKSNNQLDMIASIRALDILKSRFSMSDKDFVEVFHNLKTISDAFDKWIEKWQSNGWKNHDRKLVKNIEEWKSLLEYYQRFMIRFSHLSNDDKVMKKAKKMIRKTLSNSTINH